MGAVRDVIAFLRADDKKLSGDLRRARAKFRRFGKRASRDLRRSFSKATGVLKTAAGIGGLVGFATIGRDVLDFEDKLQRVGSQAGQTSKEVRGLRNDITKLSDATGLSRTQLVGGIDELVNLQGKTAVNADNLDTMATAMLGTGAAAEDVAGLMFALNNNLGIQKEEMKGVLSIIDKIGTEASVPFSELSRELAALTGRAQEFQQTGARGAANLVAAVQVLRERFKGTSEAANALAGAMVAIQKKEKTLNQLGVVTRTANGEMRDLFETIFDIANNKRIGKKGLITVIGRAEAAQAIRTVSDLRGKMEDFVKLGTQNKGFLDERALARQNSEIGRINKAWTNVKNTLAKVLTPELLEKFAGAMEKLAEVVEFVTKHIGLFAAAWVAAKLAGIALKISDIASTSATLAGTLGKASGAVGVLAAGFAGFTIGTALDEALGLSDAISDILVGFAKIDARASTALVRDQAKGLGFGGTGVQQAFTKTQIAGRGGLNKFQKRQAVSLANFAERSGLVGTRGKINRNTAREFATRGLTTPEIAAGGGAEKLTDNLINAIRFATQSRERQKGDLFAGDVAAAGGAPRGEQISIKVTGQFRFDQNSNVVLENPRIQKDRRGVTQ